MSERKVGAAWHLVYPFLVWVLLAIPSWTTASRVWFVAIRTMDQEVRFGPKDYCRFDVVVQDGGARTVRGTGCIAAGWSYQIEPGSLGMDLPGPVSTTLSRAAVILILCRWAFPMSSA